MWYILPALLHSHDGQVKRRERFASVERRGIALFLSWVTGYSCLASAWRGDPFHEAMDEAKEYSLPFPVVCGCSSTQLSRGNANSRP